MIKQQHITPSLLGASVRCQRRGWLMAHGVAIIQEPERPGRQKQHLPKQQGNWIYEVRLSSAARMDGWNKSEQVAVEYKTEEPHVAHVLQGWAYWQVLESMGVKNAEVQLWYPTERKEKAKQLADGMGLPCRLIEEAGMVAIWLNSPDVESKETIEKATEKIKKVAAGVSPPAPQPRTAPACKQCVYHDFCHL